MDGIFSFKNKVCFSYKPEMKNIKSQTTNKIKNGFMWFMYNCASGTSAYLTKSANHKARRSTEVSPTNNIKVSLRRVILIN